MTKIKIPVKNEVAEIEVDIRKELNNHLFKFEKNTITMVFDMVSSVFKEVNTDRHVRNELESTLSEDDFGIPDSDNIYSLNQKEALTGLDFAISKYTNGEVLSYDTCMYYFSNLNRILTASATLNTVNRAFNELYMIDFESAPEVAPELIEAMIKEVEDFKPEYERLIYELDQERKLLSEINNLLIIAPIERMDHFESVRYRRAKRQIEYLLYQQHHTSIATEHVYRITYKGNAE